MWHTSYGIYTTFLHSMAASQCPELEDPENGRVKFMSGGRTVGSKVWYICDPGFVLVGSETRTCQSNLRWTPEAPVCQRKEKLHNI